MSIHLRLTGMAGAAAAALPVFLAVPVAGYAQIEEITVTARRREESLQDVPLAVSAFTSQQIDRQGITGLADITNLDPSVQFDTAYGPADTRITIRGLSNTRGRSNVAFLIDGIDVTTENLNAAGSGLLANRRLLNDLERIEIVKGPQSALYGRAAFSGAISYVTKNPGDEFQGKVGVELGEYGIKQYSFGVDGPLVEGVLGMRLSGVRYEDNGFYRNSLSGEPVGDTEGYGLAWTTVYTPSEELRFKLRAEYSNEDIGPLPNIRIGGGRTGYNMKFFPYPQSALDAGIGQTPQYQQSLPGNFWWQGQPVAAPGVVSSPGSTSTALINFGQYCPPEIVAQLAADGISAPGFCLPTTFGKGRGKAVTHSEDPLTGKDFVGSELETFRLALETTLDVGVGVFSSYTGWTDFESRETYDQDWQASGRPDQLGLAEGSPLYVPGAKQGFGMQSSRSRTDTRQFSQELRFASNLDGPLQFTAGALYWDERRRFRDEAVIIFCTLSRRASVAVDAPIVLAPNTFCDGESGRLDNYQELYNLLQPQTPGPWLAETRSWSFYGLLEWEIVEGLRLSLENRYISENFSFSKPNQSSCFTFFGPNPAPTQMVGPNPGDTFGQQNCLSTLILDPNFMLAPTPPSLIGTQGYRINRGSERSHFSTPKLTLQWFPRDDRQLYFSVAKAQKPGGISAAPGSGSATPLEDDRFDSEKMRAWELGAKTDWTLAGLLRLNGAVFFQDYSDKQVGTQLLRDGFLAARVVNASSAEVWGVEFDALWQPDLVDGLTLTAGWTWLDATYKNFHDDSVNLLRISQIGQGCDVVWKGERGPNPTDLSDERNGVPFCRLDLSGKRLERTPRNAGVLAANLTRPFRDSPFDWFVELNTTYQGKRYLDPDNTVYFPSYWLADARLGLTGDRWDIIAFVDNLFNDDKIKTGGGGPDFGSQVVELGFVAGFGASHFFGTLPPPRVFGMRASYRFGGPP